MSDREPTPASAPGIERPPAAVPSVADGVEHPVDPRSVTLDRVVGTIRTVVLSGTSLVFIVVALLGGGRGAAVTFALLGAWGMLTVLLLVQALLWPGLRYKLTRYRIDEHGIRYRTGVVWRSTVDVPRSRVQHTDVNQGPIERSMELATLILHTAGTQHAAIPIPGLSESTARRLRDFLLDEESGLDA